MSPQSMISCRTGNAGRLGGPLGCPAQMLRTAILLMLALRSALLCDRRRDPPPPSFLPLRGAGVRLRPRISNAFNGPNLYVDWTPVCLRDIIGRRSIVVYNTDVLGVCRRCGLGPNPNAAPIFIMGEGLPPGRAALDAPGGV